MWRPGVTDLAGNPLKGNVDDNSGSGGGGGAAAAGRDFEQALPVLPGDVNRSGVVLADDYSEVKQRFFTSTAVERNGRSTYSAFHDVDGNGIILANDYIAVYRRFFDRLPEGEYTRSLFA
jgi:hypothetical protein